MRSRLTTTVLTIFLGLAFTTGAFAQNETQPPTPTPVTPGKNWSILYTSGEYAMLVKYDGRFVIAKESEIIEDWVFGDFRVLAIEGERIKVEHIQTGAVGWIDRKHKVDDVAVSKPEELVQVSVPTSVLPESKYLDHQFDFPIKVEAMPLNVMLNFISSELDITYKYVAQGNRAVSIDLEKPTLRELLLSTLPPIGMWFHFEGDVLSLYPLQKVLKESPTDAPVASVKQGGVASRPHHPVFEQRLKGEVSAVGIEVTRILHLLYSECGMDYVWKDAGDEIPKVTFTLNSPTVGEVINVLMFGANLEYTIQDDVIYYWIAEDTRIPKIERYHPAFDTQLEEPFVSVRVHVTEIFKVLSDKSGLKFVLENPEDYNPKITMTLDRPTVGDIVKAIVGAYDLVYVIKNDEVVFRKSSN